MKRFVVAMCLVVGCSGNEGKKEEAKVVEVPTQASLEGSKCLGNRIPPTNYLQETAFVAVSEDNASERAKTKAVTTLRDRICQGYRCSEIEPQITLWNTQQDAVQVCAMAVVKASAVESFNAAPRASFDSDLIQVASELEGVLLTAKKKRVSIDNVHDLGIDGGPRAEWLVDRISTAISKTNLELVRLPPDWDGLKLPKGVDAVLRGRVTRLHGRESMLEVTWNLDMGTQLKSASPVTFPEMIGPVVEGGDLTELPTENKDVSLRFDARPGGALCNGQTTEIKLATSEPLQARVLDLYGDGEALMIWGGATKVGEPSSLGEFQAVKLEGTLAAERFLVIAAKNGSDLGAYANAPVPCRIPAVDARNLHAGKGVPDAARPFTTSRSYRIMDGDDCSKFEAPAATALDGLPACW